ncbi:serine protease [Methylomonas sp. SURF-1]|uniref:Serine protease n=1 Tax=Methylomonas aurea TaxID=2952224 RepID=A0ABT1UNP2_9GAMM|nr:serine protease [Methylomonas sp. SURF-1]MCQ8183747.1 serine protease [Methylomonas sp. SURF-1]
MANKFKFICILCLMGLIVPRWTTHAYAQDSGPYPELITYQQFKSVRFMPSSGFVLENGSTTSSLTINAPLGAIYFRLRIAEIDANPTAQYRLTITDADSGQLIAQIKAAELAELSVFLTPPIFASKIKISVDELDAPQPLSFVVAELLVHRNNDNIVFRPQSLTPGLTIFRSMPQGDPLLNLSRSVAKLYMGKDRDGPVCTGFLVSRDLLLTNYHCLEKSDQFMKSRENPTKKCGDVYAHFDYQTAESKKSGQMPVCQKVLVYGAYPKEEGELDQGDFALLQFTASTLRLPESGRSRPFLTLARSAISDEGSKRVQMIQHPWGFPLHFSLGCIAQTDPDRSLVIQHNCSTEPGSSGSPVLDAKGEVVAIHHTPHKNKITSPNENDKRMEELKAAVEWRNEATPLSSIMNKLEPYLATKNDINKR